MSLFISPRQPVFAAAKARRALARLGFLAAFLAAAAQLSACAGLPPLKERHLAAKALEMARVHRAAEFAPSHFLRSKKLYKEALRLYEDRYYGLAKGRFQEARRESERAENISRLKKHKTGDFS